LLLEVKVQQVLSVGSGMIKLILLRRSMRARIEPIPQTEEQKMALQIAQQLQQTLGKIFPGGVVVSGPGAGSGAAFGGEQWDARIEMDITEEEYTQLGKPGINDTIRIDAMKIE